MKVVFAVLKLDPATGRCALAGSRQEYQHIAQDGTGWTCASTYRTWETQAEAETFAAAANLPAGSWLAVPRYATGPDGDYILIPEDDKP